MGKAIDLTGQRFGRLVVLSRTDNKGKNTAWLCKCDCGNITKVITPNLKGGKSKSCGCGVIDSLIKRSRTHGESHKTRLYSIWRGMKDRCYRQTHPYYNHYGGRGITVCPEWKTSYVAFRDWAKSHGYSDDLSIDRIDNDKGYSPENCRWASNAQQANNQSRNRQITFQGRTQNLTQWAEELGISFPVLHYRLKHGWSIEDSLTTPTNHKKPKINP